MVGPKKNKQVSSDKFSRIEKVGKVGGEKVGKGLGENWRVAFHDVFCSFFKPLGHLFIFY